MLPNPMLTQSLLLTRDLLLSGAAALELNAPNGTPWSAGAAFPSSRDDASARQAIKRLQPNVRAILAEMDVLDGVMFELTAGKSAKLSTRAGAHVIAEINAPAAAEFLEQLKLVHSYADLRGERASEVLAQAVPQTANWSAIAGLMPDRHRFTWELLGIGLRFAMMTVMRFKRALGCPRPMEYSALVQPMILTPGYTAFPSGHATESYFVAEFLPILMDSARPPDGKATSFFWTLKPGLTERDADLKKSQGSLRSQLHRVAYRISENRVVAGLHFPIDSVAGQLLGVTLARYFASCCGLTGPTRPNPINPVEHYGLLVGHKFDLKAGASERVEPSLDYGIDDPASRMQITPGRNSIGQGGSLVLDWLTREAQDELTV